MENQALATTLKERVLSRLAFSSLTSACFLALGQCPEQEAFWLHHGVVLRQKEKQQGKHQ